MSDAAHLRPVRMSAERADPLFASAYKAGYLESAMETLLLQLPWESRENLAAFIREAIERAGQGMIGKSDA